MNTSLYWEDIKRIAELEYSWDKFYKKTLLIAGASGMIGTFLVDVLMYRNKTHNMKCKVIAVGKNRDKGYSRFQNYWTSPYFEFISWDITTPYPSLVMYYNPYIHNISLKIFLHHLYFLHIFLQKKEIIILYCFSPLLNLANFLRAMVKNNEL